MSYPPLCSLVHVTEVLSGRIGMNSMESKVSFCVEALDRKGCYGSQAEHMAPSNSKLSRVSLPLFPRKAAA